MSGLGDKVVSASIGLVLGLGSAAIVPAAWAQEEQSEPQTESASAYSTEASEAPASMADSDASASDASVDVIPVQQISAEPEADAPLAAASGDAVALDEVVVTARKRQESIQEVPLSVTAFSSKQMDQRGYAGLEDIAAATPGFTFEGFMTGGAHGNPVIRGLAQTFTTSRIQNVSFFLDGVYLQRQSMLNLGMIDMERIEVVKGPQNALYGRNAFAGAVNYVTQEPTAEPTGYVSASFGDNKRTEYRASLSGAIDSDATLLGKATVGFSSWDGGTHNNHPVANADPAGPNLHGNLGGHEDTTYSVSLLYQPRGDLRLRGNYYRSEIEHETAAGYSISGVNAARFGLRFDDQNDLNCNTATVEDIAPYPERTHTGYSAYCGELPLYASDIAPRKVAGIVVDPRAIGSISTTDAITFLTDYDINGDLSVHYLFGFADHTSYTDGGASDEDPLAGRGLATNALVTTLDNQDPAGYTFANTASGRPNSELNTFSHELRFDWLATDDLRSSFGLYYSRVKDEEWTTLYINDLCNADSAENIMHCNEPLSSPNSLKQQTVITAAAAYDQYTRQHGGVNRGEWTGFDESISAAFMSVSYKFLEELEGTVEARYTYEDKKIDRYTDSFMLAPGQSITYLPPDRVLPFGNTLTSTIAVPHDQAKFSQVTPRAILNWNPVAGHTVYGSVAKGVKAGGFNNANTESELTYKDEENWTYELGSKNMFFGRRVMLNGSVYYIDWTGLQGGVPPSVAGLSTSDIIANIGGANSIGVEIESRFGITDTLSLDLSGTYNDATFKEGTKYAAGDQVNGSFHCDGVTCPADGDISGNQLARTSKIQYSAGLNYDTYFNGWMLTARVDTNYQSKQYVDPLNLAWVPDRQLTNASLKIVSPESHWELISWVKNLTDENYAANSFLIGVFNQYMVAKGAPRSFGFTVKYKL